MEVSTKQERIAKLAKQSPDLSFVSLNHYLDPEWFKAAYQKMRKDSAPGVDGVSVKEYGEELESNLSSLIDLAKSGRYYAPPVKRVHIPKGSGRETRPIGIPATDDKLLQKAVSMILEPIYEQDFRDCSYGFRPGRSQHQALESVWKQCMDLGVECILDVDISKFFDMLDHAHLREFFRLRVCDGVITRLIGKWLKAGVLEDGSRHFPEKGTPQGGSISPLFSNIYLHYVLDQWFEDVVKPRLAGRVFMVRFADDVVMGFSDRRDAEKILEGLPERLGKYGLSLHPDKTRLVEFSRPKGSGAAKPGTFDFLGFTHFWGKSRRGFWVVKRKTARDRFNRKLKEIGEWCRRNRHLPVSEQHKKLSQKLIGHFVYYGITGNSLWLDKFREEVKKLWRKWLNRRNRNNPMPWKRFQILIQQHYPLPPARAVHSIYAANP